MNLHSERRPFPPSILTASLLVLALALAVSGCSSSPEQAGQTVESLAIPAPDLSTAEPAVRQQLEDQLAVVEAALTNTSASPTETAEELGDLGLLYILYDFLDAAEASFRKAQELKPEDHRWPYLRGYLLQVEGRLPEATDHFARALELDPKFLPAHLRLGRARLELGELEAARAQFERALTLDAEAPAAIEGLGKIAEAEGDPDAATSYFEQALALAPEATSLHYALSQNYRRLGRAEEADAQLEVAGDVSVRIADPLLNPLADLGQSSQFYLMQAATAMDSEQWEVASAAWERAIELDPTQIDAYRGLSLCLERLGDLDGAMTPLTEALRQIENDPELANADKKAELLRQRGGLAVLTQQDGEAVESFRASLAAVPEQPAVRSKLANALARQGQAKEAIAELNLLLANEETASPALLVQRATLWVNMRDKQKAVADFERAIDLAPDNDGIRQRYAEALEFLGESAGAATAPRQAGSESSDPARSAHGLASDARRLLSQNQFEQAEVTFREAIEAAPERPDLRFELAGMLGHSGQFEKAAREFRTVLELAPTHAGAHRGLVTALVLSEQWSAARDQLQVALKQFPRNLQLASLQVRLLATNPDPNVRNGGFALELARRINGVFTDWRSREALALACAESGLFQEAVQIQEGVVAEATGNTPPQVFAQLEAKLAAFKNNQAWTISSPQELLDAAFSTRAEPRG